MRPDRLVVGEVRDAEALDLLLALNTGVPGAATIHANSAREALAQARRAAAAGRTQHRRRASCCRRSRHPSISSPTASGMPSGRRRVVEIVEPTGVAGATVEARTRLPGGCRMTFVWGAVLAAGLLLRRLAVGVAGACADAAAAAAGRARAPARVGGAHARAARGSGRRHRVLRRRPRRDRRGSSRRSRRWPSSRRSSGALAPFAWLRARRSRLRAVAPRAVARRLRPADRVGAGGHVAARCGREPRRVGAGAAAAAVRGIRARRRGIRALRLERRSGSRPRSPIRSATASSRRCAWPGRSAAPS